jgi:hypothetical protein
LTDVDEEELARPKKKGKEAKGKEAIGKTREAIKAAGRETTDG